jgi:hypothetical protein
MFAIPPVLAPIVLALLVPVGYWITTRVADELPAATRWITLAHALLSLAVFFFFPWWQAALFAGGLFIGFIPSIFVFSWLASSLPLSIELAFFLVGVGILTGSRWRLDGHAAFTVTLMPVLLTLFLVGVRSLA